jgi:hypothetical protein
MDSISGFERLCVIVAHTPGQPSLLHRRTGTTNVGWFLVWLPESSWQQHPQPCIVVSGLQVPHQPLLPTYLPMYASTFASTLPCLALPCLAFALISPPPANNQSSRPLLGCSLVHSCLRRSRRTPIVRPRPSLPRFDITSATHMSTMSPNSETLDLYGGDRPWDAAQWQTSDDRVRGGSSRSHLTVLDPRLARFHGHLDTKTLGGAGFASQHSAGELHLDLSGCSGLVLSVAGPSADGLAAAADASKRFAVTLKDQLPGERPDGRAKSGISWEADFTWGPQDGCAQIFLPWSDFKATYRGRDKPDAEPLDLSAIKRVGLMMRR